MAEVHVAVGVVRNAQGQVLIARRPEHLHQGGLWEFPGGKLEAGEDTATALARELREEVGIDVLSARPWLLIRHAYPDKTVLLDVWWVEQFQGTAQGLEGQALDWQQPTQLDRALFPVANGVIIERLLEVCG